MKTTGIVRRFDDLGRIVVPKEMRTSLGIGIGDPAEISMDGECVIIKKFDAADSVEQLLDKLEGELRIKGHLIKEDQLAALIEKVQEMKQIVMKSDP